MRRATIMLLIAFCVVVPADTVTTAAVAVNLVIDEACGQPSRTWAALKDTECSDDCLDQHFLCVGSCAGDSFCELRCELSLHKCLLRCNGGKG